MKRKQHTIRVLAMMLAGMLAACIPSGKVRTVYDDREFSVKLSQHDGLIVARVINASPYSQTFNYITLAPKSVYEKKENKFERIETIKELSGKSTVFAAPLPAGDYSLSDIYSYHYYYNANYSYYYQLLANADPKFGTFKVEPGKITNLGTIIYYQKPDGDKYLEVLARKDEFKEALEYLQSEKPDLHKQVDAAAAMLSWNEDDHAAERRDLYLNVAQNPVTFSGSYPQEDGGWYFTSKLGVLLNRTAQGKWNLEAMDGDYDIARFARNPEGDMVAMDQRGTLFLKTRSSGKWITIPKPETEDTIGYIGLGNARDIHVISTSETEIKVYSGKISDNPGWTVSLTYEPHLGWAPPDQPIAAKPNRKGRIIKGKIKRFSAVKVQGKILALTNDKLYELHPELDGATERAVDFEPVAMHYYNAYNQLSISRPKLTADSGMETYYTLDAGATWNPVSDRYDICPNSKKKTSCDNNDLHRFKSRAHFGIPVFFADGYGYSILYEVPSSGGIFKGPERDTAYSLIFSRDRGKTWMRAQGGELPKYCGGLRKGADEKTLLLSCEYSTGRFYRANRENLKWEIDYQPALF